MSAPEWTDALLPFKKELIEGRRAGIEIEATEVAEASLRPGASRIGGRPDLRAEMTWPVAVREKGGVTHELPLAFVAQVRLAEVRPLDQERFLPAAGLLSFFVLDSLRVDAAVGWAPDEDTRRDRVRVVYTAPDVPLAPREPPASLPATHVLPVARMRFRKVPTWPQVEGTLIGGRGAPAGLTFDEAAWDSWAETAPESPPAQLLGHPAGVEFPIGHDPDARLLLSLDTSVVADGAGIFGRNGFLFVGIPGDALAAGAWERAFLKEW